GARPDTVREILEGLEHDENVETVDQVVKPAAKVDKAMLRREFSKIWDTERMIDYCVNKTAAVAVLPNGDIITVDKQSIEKNFCFGESGYDYDDAMHAAAHARTSQEYFKRENMKCFNEVVRSLGDLLAGNSNYYVFIRRKAYSGQSDDCHLATFEWLRLTEVLDACGGSAFLEELPGKEITARGCPGRIATEEELKIILDAYTDARNAHEKRVDVYLKKYGLSKVHSWTYWREA
ncbi:MAG: hypothetical protein IIZ35_03345, partial [Clostridia bacterium]|nr:hypothetical protein [Clostridia bacterium]